MDHGMNFKIDANVRHVRYTTHSLPRLYYIHQPRSCAIVGYLV